MRVSPSSDRLSAAQERELEERLNQFEESWERQSPRIENFLPPAADSSYRRRVLVELIQIDLERRWSRDPAALCADGTFPLRPRVEDYLQRYPEIGPGPLALDLIGQEYRVRWIARDHPTHAEYVARFPTHGVSLRATLAAIDAELAEEFSGRGSKLPSPPVGPRPAATASQTMILSCADLVRTLKAYALLSPARIDELERDMQSGAGEPRALARELLARNWLTAYQVNQLFLGRVHELVIGPYRVLERLGEGGAGQVFKAQHQAMNRIVALKVIRRELLSEPEVLNRFYREIEVVGQLSHRHIVHAYDAGPFGATHFLAMEYVEGIDLHRLVKQDGPLPVETACRYVRQAALGLQHAHERGLVHRDVKPSNLLVSSDGVVKVLDLGLARLHQASITDEVTSVLTPVDSVMMGTPDYMAPEQAVNFHAADIRADIYSLGCTLHYLLAGQPPFPGGNLTEKLLRHQQAEPPLLPPEVPSEVAAIVRKMLAKRPEDRYPMPAGVAQALAIAGNGGTTLVCPHTPGSLSGTSVPRRRRRLVPLIALAGIGLFGLVMVGLTAKTEPTATTATAEPARVAMQALLAHIAVAPADVDQLRRELTGFRRDHPDEQEPLRQELLNLRARSPGTLAALRASELLPELPSPLDQLERKEIPSAERFDWQPEALVGVLGEHRWRHWGIVRSAAYSPDSKYLATAGDDALIRLWAPTKYELFRTLHGHRRAVCALVFSPDGKTLASAAEDGTVRFWDPSNGVNWATLEAHTRPIRALVFCPDGNTLATGSDDWTEKLWQVDLPARRVATQPRVVVREHHGPVNALIFLPPERTLLVSGSADGTVAFWDTSASQARSPLKLRGEVVALAADGEGKVLFAGIKLTPARGAVAAWDLQDRKELPLPSGNAGLPHALACAGDGKTIAAAGSDGVVRQWKAGRKMDEPVPIKWSGPIHALAYAPDGHAMAMGRADGVLLHHFDSAGDSILGSEIEAGFVAIAPDGRTILVGEGIPGKPLREGRVRVWEVPALRGRTLLLGPGPAPTALAFSLDGRLAAAADQAGALHVWDWPSMKLRAPFEALAERRVLRNLAFAPNGRSLVGTETPSKEPAGLRMWDIPSGRLRVGLQPPLEPDGYFSLAFASDSRSLAAGHLQRGVKILDTATGKERASISITASIRRQCVAYADDGRTLAIGAGGGVVKIWDTIDNKELPALRSSSGLNAVCGLAFAHGPALVAVTPDGQIIHWPHLPSDKHVALALPGSVRAAVVASDGRHVITANTNGTVYVFRLSPILASAGR
jgi:serine/threonine protein kinase/WD40 repeat protein